MTEFDQVFLGWQKQRGNLRWFTEEYPCKVPLLTRLRAGCKLQKQGEN